jgi:GTP-binding protein HflX
MLDLVLDPADGAGVSWLHRNTEVMAKSMRADGQYAVKVRVDPTKAEIVRRKYVAAGP